MLSFFRHTLIFKVKHPKFGPFLRAPEAEKKKQPQLHHFLEKNKIVCMEKVSCIYDSSTYIKAVKLYEGKNEKNALVSITTIQLYQHRHWVTRLNF